MAKPSFGRTRRERSVKSEPRGRGRGEGKNFSKIRENGFFPTQTDPPSPVSPRFKNTRQKASRERIPSFHLLIFPSRHIALSLSALRPAPLGSDLSSSGALRSDPFFAPGWSVYSQLKASKFRQHPHVFLASAFRVCFSFFRKWCSSGLALRFFVFPTWRARPFERSSRLSVQGCSQFRNFVWSFGFFFSWVKTWSFGSSGTRLKGISRFRSSFSRGQRTWRGKVERGS